MDKTTDIDTEGILMVIDLIHARRTHISLIISILIVSKLKVIFFDFSYPWLSHRIIDEVVAFRQDEQHVYRKLRDRIKTFSLCYNYVPANEFIPVLQSHFFQQFGSVFAKQSQNLIRLASFDQFEFLLLSKREILGGFVLVHEFRGKANQLPCAVNIFPMIRNAKESFSLLE